MSMNRKIIYQQIRDELASLGYHPLRPIFLDRWMRYRLLVVAVNHLATVLGRDPYRVYQALLCRAERTRKGSPFTPSRQAQAQQGEPLGRGRVSVICPFCGHDILDAGPLSRDEVFADQQHRGTTMPERRERERCV